MSTDLPVLVLAFNRPAQLRAQLTELERAGANRLWIAQDGPRLGHPTDALRCEEVTQLIAGIDFAEVRSLVRRENLGCGRAVAAGIGWFFDEVECGAVLEDDCLVDVSFFSFAEALLVRYRAAQTVGTIGAYSPVPWADGHDYSFGSAFVWGWATWADRWRLHDLRMERWRHWSARRRAARTLGPMWHTLRGGFAATHRGRIDTWDYQWAYALASHGMVSVVPRVNLVENIGFGEGATHTMERSAPVPPRGHLLPPFDHPSHVRADPVLLERHASVLASQAPHVIRRAARRALTRGVRGLR